MKLNFYYFDKIEQKFKKKDPDLISIFFMIDKCYPSIDYTIKD